MWGEKHMDGSTWWKISLRNPFPGNNTKTPGSGEEPVCTFLKGSKKRVQRSFLEKGEWEE
jgi:hypothetical protein